jgi:hypothetical protein
MGLTPGTKRGPYEAHFRDDTSKLYVAEGLR